MSSGDFTEVDTMRKIYRDPAFSAAQPCPYRGQIACKDCDLFRSSDPDSRCDMAAGRIIQQQAWEDGFAACEVKVREALRGHPQSELWGEQGLLAATMRSNDGYRERIEHLGRLMRSAKKATSFAHAMCFIEKALRLCEEIE